MYIFHVFVKSLDRRFSFFVCNIVWMEQALHIVLDNEWNNNISNAIERSIRFTESLALFSSDAHAAGDIDRDTCETYIYIYIPGTRLCLFFTLNSSLYPSTSNSIVSVLVLHPVIERYKLCGEPLRHNRATTTRTYPVYEAYMGGYICSMAYIYTGIYYIHIPGI